MTALTRYALASAAAAAIVASTAGTASAQTIGTFPFRLQPFCNTVHLTVTQEGNTYRLAGWDENCQPGTDFARFPLTGIILPNNDGTLHLAFTVIRTNGIPVATSIRDFNLASLSGNWTDSAGNSGTAVLNGATGNSGARPGPTSTVPANSVTSVNIVDNSINAVDVNRFQVQLRVYDSCPDGQAMRGINADGTVVCTATGAPLTLLAEAGSGGTFSGCTDFAALNFGTVSAAGTMVCDATFHALFDHRTGTTSRLEFDLATAPAACGGSQASVFEMPGAFPSVTGHDVTVRVHRSFPVSAGPLIAHLNGRALSMASATRQAFNLSCTFTPQ